MVDARRRWRAGGCPGITGGSSRTTVKVSTRPRCIARAFYGRSPRQRPVRSEEAVGLGFVLASGVVRRL
eukprot:11063945-Lingulodinium_polyedra.AAC.1